MRWWYNSSHFTCLGLSLGDKAATDSASLAFLLYSFNYELILSPFSTLINTFDPVLTTHVCHQLNECTLLSRRRRKRLSFRSDWDDVMMFISHGLPELHQQIEETRPR